MDKQQLKVFASEVIRDVATQTHTDWEKYLNPLLDKWNTILEAHDNQIRKDLLEDIRNNRFVLDDFYGDGMDNFDSTDDIKDARKMRDYANKILNNRIDRVASKYRIKE